MVEVKDIIMRNPDVIVLIDEDIVNEISLIDPSPNWNVKPIDEFRPKSKPLENYIKLPKEITVEFIGDASLFSNLLCLLKEPYIGVDSEWRPHITSVGE
jgi:hypothetical protein